MCGETVDGAGGNVCVEETVDGEDEAVAMGEWMQELWMVKLKR